MPERQYRHDKQRYETISLTLSSKVVDFLEKKMSEIDNKNMSAYIEEAGLNFNINIPQRRNYGEKPCRKSFTFSKDFIAEIKKTGNMSMAIETALVHKFSL